MNYLEFSLENVEEKTRELFKNIKNNGFNYELVIFIAKGAYPIGTKLAELNNVPLLEISARRKGGRLKRILKPFMKFIPKSFLIRMRKKEMNSSYHKTNNDRNVTYLESRFEKYKNLKKIILVDDSIDTGYSVIEVKKKLNEIFKNAEIKIAVFNTMSESLIKPDFDLYNDTMISGPWSNDSKYYKNFITIYNDWKKNYERKD